MDPSGCPEGYYTDRAFQRAPVGECGTPIWLYWSAMMTIALLRFLAFFKKLDNYVKSRANSAVSRKPYNSLFTHLFAASMYLVVIVLVGIDVANVDNGISFSMYSLAYLSFIINYSVLLLRTVRLGQRLIPKHNEHELGDLSFLSRFNSVGIILVVTQSLCAGVSCIGFTILSPLIPEHDILLGQIGFSSKGIFQMLCILGIVMQFQRCINALSSYRSPVSVAPSAVERESQLARTIHIMRQRQMTIWVLGFGVSILFVLLGGEALPWTWHWVLLATAGPETFGSLVLEMLFTSNKKTGTFRSSAEDRQRNLEGAIIAFNAQGNLGSDSDGHSERVASSTEMERPKRGPIGKRFRRRQKPAFDLTRVTEEQTYLSTMNPMATRNSINTTVELETLSENLGSGTNEVKTDSA